jgi:hypothetical protein
MIGMSRFHDLGSDMRVAPLYRPPAAAAPAMPTGLTGAALEQSQEDERSNQWRNAFAGDVGNWQLQRGGYAQALSDAYVGAQNPMAATNMADNRRQAAFRSARTGQRGGSADMSRRSRVQQDYASRLAQILAGGHQIRQGQLDTDRDAAQAWRMQSFQAAPGQQLATQSQLNASRARTGQAQDMATMTQQGIADNMGYDNFMSQLIGSQMSNAGRGISTAGQMGYGPEWVQALSRNMVG